MAVLLDDDSELGDYDPVSGCLFSGCLYDLLAGLVALLGIIGLVAMTAIE